MRSGKKWALTSIFVAFKLQRYKWNLSQSGDVLMTTSFTSIHNRTRFLLLITLCGPASLLYMSFRDSSNTHYTPPLLNSASSASADSPLEISPNPISLGAVLTSKKAKASFTLANHWSQIVAVERIETSCPCLTISPESFHIQPGERKSIAVEFDPSTEPDFQGGLSIEITGYAVGSVVFHTLVKVEVLSKARVNIEPPVPSRTREVRL